MKLSTTLLAFVCSTCVAQFVAAQTSTLSRHDQLKIAAQKICPVSGKPLGSMGQPPKVKVGKEEIFLCCKNCTKGQINKQHWAAIHANFAEAQGKCPVMEKNLPANPKFTFVNGQIVYICCPPCTKKIQADPAKYLATVDDYYEASLKVSSRSSAPQSGQSHATRANGGTRSPSTSNRDQLKMAIQKVCPVSGNQLGSMGDPIKVKAGGMDLFVCCEGCKKGKVNKEHWATIRGNIAKAQGICPVMEKELPANAKSTVVEGQLVFVCCPPCTKKIDKDPSRFLTKVDSYYMSSLKQQSKSPTARR